MITVDEIMSTDLVTLRDTDTLSMARSLMSNKHIHHVPILGKNDNLVGLVTHSDILAASESTLHDKDLTAVDSTLLKDIMATNLIMADERTSLLQAAINLLEHEHGCLPVVKDKQLVGIVTDSDFVAVAINLLEQKETTDFESEVNFDTDEENYMDDLDLGIDLTPTKNLD